MNIHEYQARALLKAQGIPMLDGDVASTPTEAEAIARRLGGTVSSRPRCMPGGPRQGRWRPAGQDPGEALDHAAEILGMQIKGLTVQKVLVVPAAEIASESYVGLIMDRETQRPSSWSARREGGHRGSRRQDSGEDRPLSVDPTYGLFPHQALALAFALYREFAQVKAAGEDHGAALHGVSRERRLAGRDQPAGDDTRTDGCSRSTPRS
jgi:succinyl-CoA synthetase beta subunit